MVIILYYRYFCESFTRGFFNGPTLYFSNNLIILRKKGKKYKKNLPPLHVMYTHCFSNKFDVFVEFFIFLNL